MKLHTPYKSKSVGKLESDSMISRVRQFVITYGGHAIQFANDDTERVISIWCLAKRISNIINLIEEPTC